MKYIKTIEEQQYESWRKIKAYLSIPQIIIEKLLSKLIKFVPYLNLEYDELAAKIDFDKSLNIPNTVKNEPKKLTLDDIENVTLRNSLKLTGLFNNWNVYFLRTNIDASDEKEKNVLYISKDEMKKGDNYYSDRLSISNDNQIYIIFALKSYRHEEMGKERAISYKKKKDKKLEKEVNKAISENKYNRRWSDGNEPVLFRVVKENRLDLFNKIIKSVSKDKAKELLSMKITDDGWTDSVFGKTVLDYANTKQYHVSEELKNAIMSVLYTPEELEDMRYQEDLKKYNL